ncbi:MAG: Crp/Fnr family transcriptional regulator [Anderseniella sp.]|jgi:CRP-like cAMP-binding protein|nr:Crp/Fnr family transcriptional regulator [Anderseniella sp.]
MNPDPVRAALPDPMGWLTSLPADLRTEVLRRSSEITKRQGEVVYRADDLAGGIFTLVSGRLDFHWTHLLGGETLFYAVGPGWWVGDLAAISGQPRRLDLVAGRDSKVLHLSRATIRELSASRPDFPPSLFGMISQTLRAAISVLEFMSIEDPTIRTAACLRSLNRTGSGWNGSLPFSQNELAVICKISRRRMNAAVNDLNRNNIIDSGYGKINIPDPRRIYELLFNKNFNL